jgi:hypothetical protein
MTHSIKSVRAAIALANLKAPSLAKRATMAVADMQYKIISLEAIVAEQEAIISQMKSDAAWKRDAENGQQMGQL